MLSKKGLFTTASTHNGLWAPASTSSRRWPKKRGPGAEERRAGFTPASAADAGIALFRACHYLPLSLIIVCRTGSHHADRRLGPPGRGYHDRGAHARSLSNLQASETRSAHLAGQIGGPHLP